MAERSRWGTSAVLTPAHATPGDAIKAFFDSRPDEVAQPFDFSRDDEVAVVAKGDSMFGGEALRAFSHEVDVRALA